MKDRRPFIPHSAFRILHWIRAPRRGPFGEKGFEALPALLGQPGRSAGLRRLLQADRLS